MGHAEQNQQIKHQISRNVYLMYEVYKKSKEPLFGHFWPSKYTSFTCKNEVYATNVSHISCTLMISEKTWY